MERLFLKITLDVKRKNFNFSTFTPYHSINTGQSRSIEKEYDVLLAMRSVPSLAYEIIQDESRRAMIPVEKHIVVIRRLSA